MKLVPIAVFRARNIKTNPLIQISVGIENNRIFYITDSGNKSIEYKNIAQAILDISDLWGGWHDFKIIYREE